MGQPNNAVNLTREERAQLESMTRSRSFPHGLVRRAQIVLLSAEGVGGSEIALRCESPDGEPLLS